MTLLPDQDHGLVLLDEAARGERLDELHVQLELEVGVARGVDSFDRGAIGTRDAGTRPASAFGSGAKASGGRTLRSGIRRSILPAAALSPPRHSR
jgi:hypothetical protein